MEETKILTLHLQGKNGVNISLRKYEQIKVFIIDCITAKGEITYKELNEKAVNKLSKNFEGEVGWYIVTVKLDLEARSIIERVPKTSPHKLRLKK